MRGDNEQEIHGPCIILLLLHVLEIEGKETVKRGNAKGIKGPKCM